MTYEEVTGTVIRLVAESFDLPEADITLATSADDIAAWDSLQHTILLMRLQNSLGVELSGRRSYAGRTVKDLVELAYAASKH
jgi:acyl carrier protein